jgi:hypothetical protein
MNARMIQTCFYRRVPCRCETDLPCRWKFCICGNVQKQKKKRKVAIRPVRFTITTPIAITIALLLPNVSSGNSDGSKHRHLPNDHYWDEEESAIEPCHIDYHGLFDPTLMRLFPSKNMTCLLFSGHHQQALLPPHERRRPSLKFETPRKRIN